MAQEQVGVCICCFDDEAIGHLRCDASHLICDICANSLVRSQIGGAELRRRQGGLACVAVDGTHHSCLQSRETAFARDVVEPLLEPDVRQQFCEFLSPIIAEDDSSLRNLQHWVAELLSITCPKCDEFLDPRPDGCIAMTCLHCSASFCWMCFWTGDHDAHGHALETHGDYFPPPRAIMSWHTRWRWRRIARLVTSDELPSRPPPAVQARDDAEIGRQTLTEEQIAKLKPAGPLLRDFGLWPFPPAQPRVYDGGANSDVITAARNGDEARLLEALEAGGSIDELDNRLMSTLMHAAHGGHLAMVGLLLRLARERYVVRDGEGAAAEAAFHAFVTLRDWNGSTALIYACREGHTDTAAAVIDSLDSAPEVQRALVLAEDDGRVSALAHACRAGADVRVVELLLRRGAEVLRPNERSDASSLRAMGRETPLYFALCAGHSPNCCAVVTMLLKHITVPQDDAAATTDAHSLGLAAAAMLVNDCAALARAYTAGLDSQSELVQRLFDLPGLDVDAMEPYSGFTALAAAARDGRLSEVRALLARSKHGGGGGGGGDGGGGQPAARRGRRGRDALAEAFRGGHEAVVQELLSVPPHPPSEEELKTWGKRRTAGRWLGRAACLDSAEQVRKWLEHVSSPARAEDKAAGLAYLGSDNFTALHFAARHGSVAVVALLVRAGANAFATDTYGRMPHHYARLYRHEAVLDVLPPISEEELERLAQARRNLIDDDDSDDEEAAMLYTYDMWDDWYEEQARQEEAAAALAAEAAAAGPLPLPVMRQMTTDEERAVRAEQERWRRVAALVDLAAIVEAPPPARLRHHMAVVKQKTAPF